MKTTTLRTPLVSVIVPTHGRPGFLPRAVASALAGMGAEVEVIVVPNGPDASWRDALAAHADDPRVRISPIAPPHANVARNHGMELARGKYLRFLDDDDYLYPDRAIAQYETLERSDADLCAAPVDIIDERGGVMRRYDLPDTVDIVAATLDARRNTLPTAYVFRREAIAGLRWDEALDFNQDTQWMLDVVASAEMNCVIERGASVGVWQTHDGFRVSSNIEPNLRHRAIVAMLDRTAAMLDASGRMTPARRRAHARGVWTCAHMTFPFAPRYWSRVMHRALAMDPGCHTENTIYRWAWEMGIPPLAMEWLSLPERRIMHALRQWRAARAGAVTAASPPRRRTSCDHDPEASA